MHVCLSLLTPYLKIFEKWFNVDCRDKKQIHLSFVLLLGCNFTSIGDKICNKENNYADCSYDGGDCCLSCYDEIPECGCAFTGVIMSTQFLAGENYENDLNMTWLIQVPTGQNIEINWQSFDVEAQTECK